MIYADKDTEILVQGATDVSYTDLKLPKTA